MSPRKPPAFRLEHHVSAEDALHEAVVRALRVLLLPGVEWTCFPAGHVPLPPQFAAKLARFGLARGWPDIILLHDFNTYGVELKRRDAQLSRTRIVRTRRGSLRELEGQRDVFPRLMAAGFRDIAVCRSVDDVLTALHRWDVPMRRAAVAA